MDINRAISKEGLKWKCKKHPKFPCDLICLDGDVQDRVMCLNCAKKQLIPLSNLLTMSLVLSANENDILEAYPPLKDYELSEKLMKASLHQQLDEIEAYFKKLREDIEKEVQAAQQRAKEVLIKQGKDSQELLERYKKIAEIEKLKKLIISEKESAEKDLDSFIQEKWSKAEENSKVMKDLMDRYEGKYSFSSDEPNRIIQESIKRLKTINFFQESITQKINLIKSTFGTSQSVEITKVEDSPYQLKQISSIGWGQVFIDPILDPLQKYILNIELEIKPGNEGNIIFGIMQDEEKDSSSGYEQDMCYQDNDNNYGIIKQIKGNPMPQFSKIGKHSFEVRIHLNEKLLRVASLPDYSSIAELDDPNKIDPKVAYRFFLSMYDRGDMMRITSFRTVSKFDEKM